MKNKFSIQGSYVIKKWDALTGKLLEESKPIKNLIVSSTGGYGRNIIIRQLASDTTYQIGIDSAKIGTGTNTPADSDTDLQSAVLSNIQVANSVISNNVVVFTFYITDAQLANGTYNEFGLFCDGRLFARSIISPALVKGSNQNLTVDYTLTITSS